VTKHAFRFIRTLVVLSALLGTAGYARPTDEQPAPATRLDAGVLVVKVETKSAAEKAGLARGDIVLAIDGTDVATIRDVQEAVASKRPGDKVKLTVQHGDARRTLTAELGERDGRAYLGASFEPPAMAGGQPMPPERRPAPDNRPMPRGRPLPNILARAGARVVSVAEGSPAEKAGIRNGDVITAIDGTALERTDELADLIGARRPGDTVTLEVLGPDRDSRVLKVTLGKNPRDAARAWLGVEYRMAFRLEGSTPWTGRLPLALGVRVTGVTEGGPAAKAGIERGDLLTSIDGLSVLTAREVAAAIRGHRPGDVVKVGVARGADGDKVDVAVTLAADPEDRAKAFLGVQLGGPWLVPGWPDGPGRGSRAPGGTDA